MPKLPFWSDFWKRIRGGHPHPPRQASIYRSLPLGMTVVATITVLIGGISAIAMIWWQLEQQVELRLVGAQSSTQALYVAEEKNILQIVQLVAERPTLCALLADPNVSKISAYLDALHAHTTADALVVVAADGQRIVSGSMKVPEELFFEPAQMPFADFMVLMEPTRLAVVGMSEITSADGCEIDGGRVIAVEVFDHDFMQVLAKDTGLEQNLIVGDRRIASSSVNITDWPLNPEAAEMVSRTAEACCTTGSSGDIQYYVGLAPLLNNQGDIIALSEVALPAEPIRSGALKAMALILGISAVAGLAGGALTFPLSRRITDPLYRLSDAAERMGSGDLETPIPISSGWITIDRLASQLDRARRNLQQAQQIARRELGRIVHLLGAIREGVITINIEGHITWANPDGCQILGYDVLDMLRKHYSDIFPPPPEELVTLRDILRPVRGRPVPTHLRVLNSKGSVITLSVTHSVLSDAPRNAPNEHILIIRDVSEEQAINRLRSEFLANVAHEFRTPLSAISASTELLVDEGGHMSRDDLSHLAHTMRLSTVHLQTLVNNLLESATIEAGVFRLRYRPLQVQDVLSNVAAIMSPLLQRRHQQLTLQVPDGLPSHIWADMDRLNQALVNLVENASKFSPGEVIIALCVSQEKDALTFSVLDSGPGLPSGRFGDLFNRFITGDRPRGAQYGIGLGLPIVKAIAEAHGGTVGAENRPEGGARVWFTIPMKQRGKEGEDK